jgi:hypothetical protein
LSGLDIKLLLLHGICPMPGHFFPNLPKELGLMDSSKLELDAAIQFKLGALPPSELPTDSNSGAGVFCECCGETLYFKYWTQPVVVDSYKKKTDQETHKQTRRAQSGNKTREKQSERKTEDQHKDQTGV